MILRWYIMPKIYLQLSRQTGLGKRWKVNRVILGSLDLLNLMPRTTRAPPAPRSKQGQPRLDLNLMNPLGRPNILVASHHYQFSNYQLPNSIGLTEMRSQPIDLVCQSMPFLICLWSWEIDRFNQTPGDNQIQSRVRQISVCITFQYLWAPLLGM